MKKRIIHAGIAALILQPAVCMAVESDANKLKTLEEVVVTATRTAEDIKKIPANVTVITAAEIADSGASSIVEVLGNQANIHVRTYSGNPSQAQIDLRGFGENGFGRTLVLLDGRRLNRLDMQSINWTQLPIDQIERIEIIRGSGSVLYGDAAVAGVIHIITKKGGTVPHTTLELQAGEDGFHQESAGITGSSNKFSYAANAVDQQTDGWRDRTGFKSYGGGVQLGYDISNSLSISGGASFNRTNFEMPNALTKAELIQDRTQSGYDSDEAENKYINTDFLLEGSFNNLGDVSINMVYGTSENISTRFSWGSFGVYDSKTVGIQPKYVLETDFGTFSNQLITGVDIYFENLTVDIYGEAERLNKTRTTKIDRDTVGWYIRDEVSFGDIILSGGTRVERNETRGRLNNLLTPANNFDKEKDLDGNVFDVSATWLPMENMKLYARYSTIYRYPFVDEQANYSGLGGDDFNTDLNAETGRNMEVGFAIEPLTALALGFTLYQTDMEDEINLNPITWVNENLDDTRHRGMEIFLDYKQKGIFNFQLNYTYQESTFEAGPYTGNEVPLVPNNKLAANLDLSLPYGIHLVPSLTYTDNSYLSDDYDNNSEKLDGYTVVGLLLRYKKDISKTQMTFFLGVNNLFDEEYCTWGSEWDYYYPSPGRKFFGGISGTF